MDLHDTDFINSIAVDSNINKILDELGLSGDGLPRSRKKDLFRSQRQRECPAGNWIGFYTNLRAHSCELQSQGHGEQFNPETRRHITCSLYFEGLLIVTLLPDWSLQLHAA